MKPAPNPRAEADAAVERDLRRALTEGTDTRTARLADGTTQAVDIFLDVRATANATLPSIGRGLRNAFLVFCALGQFIAIVMPGTLAIAVSAIPVLIILFLFMG